MRPVLYRLTSASICGFLIILWCPLSSHGTEQIKICTIRRNGEVVKIIEYDNQGNVIFDYQKSSSKETPLNNGFVSISAFQYDTMNRIVCEYIAASHMGLEKIVTFYSDDLNLSRSFTHANSYLFDGAYELYEPLDNLEKLLDFFSSHDSLKDSIYQIKTLRILNDSGLVLKELNFRDGIYNASTEYTYIDGTNLMSGRYDISSSVRYLYDHSRNKIRTVEIEGCDTIGDHTWKYDLSGKLISGMSIVEGSLQTTEKYEYEDMQLTNVSIFDNTGNLKKVVKYRYNKQGRCIQKLELINKIRTEYSYYYKYF